MLDCACRSSLDTSAHPADCVADTPLTRPLIGVGQGVLDRVVALTERIGEINVRERELARRIERLVREVAPALLAIPGMRRAHRRQARGRDRERRPLRDRGPLRDARGGRAATVFLRHLAPPSTQPTGQPSAERGTAPHRTAITQMLVGGGGKRTSCHRSCAYVLNGATGGESETSIPAGETRDQVPRAHAAGQDAPRVR